MRRYSPVHQNKKQHKAIKLCLNQAKTRWAWLLTETLPEAGLANLRTLTIDLSSLDVLVVYGFFTEKAAFLEGLIAAMEGYPIRTKQLLVRGLSSAEADMLLAGLSWGVEQPNSLRN